MIMDYRNLCQNPPKLEVKKDAREVIFTMISCMCNNKSYITFRKNDDGDFSMWATLPSGMGYSWSNYQTGYPQHDVEWEADSQNWNTVINMLNKGTCVVAEVKSR